MVSVIKGFGLLSIGIFSIIWIILKIISCIFIAGYISTNLLHFTNIYCWFTSIIIFSILCRLCIRDDFADKYTELVDKTVNENNDEKNPIFDVLIENYGKYDTRLIFFDESEYVIDKNANSYVDGDFIFLCDNIKGYMNPIKRGFNIDTIDKIETIK